MKFNIEKLGYTQEKLAEIAKLSTQTVNDIEGCRMWVSDKTITKLAKVLHVDVYQLLIPVDFGKNLIPEDSNGGRLLYELEDRYVSNTFHSLRFQICNSKRQIPHLLN